MSLTVYPFYLYLTTVLKTSLRKRGQSPLKKKKKKNLNVTQTDEGGSVLGCLVFLSEDLQKQLTQYENSELSHHYSIN